MQRPFTVAALAIADGPADAVGVVQLSCEERTLALTLLRAGAYRPDFVPGTLAEAVTIHLPYSAIRGLVRRSRALVLTLDRSVPTPFHRLALTRFTDDPVETLAPVHRAHRLASTLSWTLPGPLGALAAALPPESLVGGAIGRSSTALLVALGVGAAMRMAAGWLAWGGPASDRHRERFEFAMSERLGLAPVLPPALAAAPAGLLAAPSPPASSGGARRSRRPVAMGAARPDGAISSSVPPPMDAAIASSAARSSERPPASSAARPAPHVAPPSLNTTPPAAPRLPWARIVALAGVVALSAVVALVFVRRFGTTSAPAAPEIDDKVAAARAPVPPKPPPPPPPPPEERCVCARADSSLWRDGVPVLTVMTTTGADGPITPPTPKLDEHDKPVFAYDVAVVNNGARSIRETRVVLTYARRDAQNRRVAVTDRGLYWGLPLAPGAAVKWVTEGPGTEVRIDPSEPGTLEERGIAPAPADAFFALLRARHRVVRLHAARMLAYLHDPRAAEATLSIGSPIDAEAPTLRRIRAAAKPVIACDVKADGDKLHACIFNASTKPAAGFAMREIQDDEAKPARAWPVAPEVPVHDGVRLAWPLEGEPPGDVVVTDEP